MSATKTTGNSLPLLWWTVIILTLSPSVLSSDSTRKLRSMSMYSKKLERVAWRVMDSYSWHIS
ncbi:MAG: hypothetical protein A4E28_00723 [Methanocella sp. PtaU1.Bin125]|nr:MAG: hypothetical protein A4E28_00723 [Methanocella sp. PtaU1.Bin125]